MIPNSMAGPAEGAFTGECLEPFRRGTRNVLWITVREGRRFILKGLPEGLRSHPEETARLRKEYSLGLRINHPGVAGVYGFETHPIAGPVIVMEYVDGMTLGEFLCGPNRQPMKQRMAIARQIADALAYIHSLGLSHRDLKPDNILITRRNEAKIIDIGLGDSEDSVVYKQSLGTDAFGAPEQRHPTVADFRADVYSYGKILELLLPESKFRRLRAACMSDNPDARLSMQEVVETLDAAMNPKKTSIWRWILRGYGIMIAIGLVFGIAEELYTGSWRSDYSSQVEDRAEDKENEERKTAAEASRESKGDPVGTEKTDIVRTLESSPEIKVAPENTAPRNYTKKETVADVDYEAIYDKYKAEMSDCIRKFGSACDADGTYIESIVFSRSEACADIAGRMVNELSDVKCPYGEMCRLSNMFFENTMKTMEKIDGRKLE